MNQFRQIDDGVFIGAQPTANDLDVLKRQGVKTIIDFRLPGETPMPNHALAKSCGLDYANIPVNKANLSVEQADQLERLLQEKQGAILIHCASGARAAALFVATKARQNRWTSEHAFEEARRIGFDLQSSPEFSAFISKFAIPSELG